MLHKVSKNQTFPNSKSILEKDSFHLTENLDNDGNYDDIVSKTQCIIAENETFVTFEKDKCSTDNAKNVTTLDNARAVSSVTSVFEENTAPYLHGKNNLNKNNTLVFHLSRKLLKMPIKTTSLEDTQKLSIAPICSSQNISFEQLKTSFYPIFQNMTSSNTFANEIILNTHIASRRHLETLEIQKGKTQDWSHKLNVSENFFQQPLMPALGFVNDNSNENQKINLLCVFSNEANTEETSSNFNKLLHDEDIKMILPMTWNIVVAYNVLTISDENNQDITIYFRNPIKAKFDYKYSNLPSNEKFRFKSAMDVTSSLKDQFQNNRKKKLNPSFTKTVVHQSIELFNWPKSKAKRKSLKQITEKKINDSFLLLREPILFHCVERNRRKQVLMYKTHSVENVLKDGSKNDLSKILKGLLAKSIQYDGEPIHLVFEPLKLITRLKKEEIRCLNAESNRKCKHNLIRSTIYKKLLIYKQTQNLRSTQCERQSFKTVLPKNLHTMHTNTTNKVSGKPLIRTRNCFDLPKNFCTSFMIKDFDMNNCTLQEANTSQMSAEPFGIRDTYSDIGKNFCASVTRSNFDIDELFGLQRSNFRRRRNMTALKHVNVKKLVSSVFRHFFHFYSLLGGNLRSGAVITRSSSNYWLKVAGVATDSCTLKLARETFTTVAG